MCFISTPIYYPNKGDNAIKKEKKEFWERKIIRNTYEGMGNTILNKKQGIIFYFCSKDREVCQQGNRQNYQFLLNINMKA